MNNIGGLQLKRISWKVGGQQGEGIERTGEIFSKTLNRQGYFLYGYRQFSSRIKGGHTNNKIHISIEPIRVLPSTTDLLIAFDQESIDLNAHELHEDSIIIADEQFNPNMDSTYRGTLCSLPLTKIAEENGARLMRNMAAIGASCAVFQLAVDPFERVVEEMFASKGGELVQKNLATIRAGYKAMNQFMSNSLLGFPLQQADGKKRLYMTGNDAIALGSLAAGARLMPAYPITPASEIMENLIRDLPKVGGAVVQTEDEIAAATMAIGANYAGVRSFTASSGPGISLMMEAIGLSGMTETPLVIVDTQRGGPSTGLPTKHEQSDLMQMIYGTHGEIPKIVIAPSTVEESFYDMTEAFNMAEEYQCPVIVLSDLQLSLAKQTVESFHLSKVQIRRGQLLTEEQERLKENDGYFPRYKLTKSGISPRTIPGVKHGYHHVTGLEHDTVGRPNETAPNRQVQMDKRNRKLINIFESFPDPIKVENSSIQETDILLVGFGSTFGAIEEVVSVLQAEGKNIAYMQIRLVHPFPAIHVEPYFEKSKCIVVIENNATGQLANLLKMNVGFHHKIRSILKYDGNPFLSTELLIKVKEVLASEYINV